MDRTSPPERWTASWPSPAKVNLCLRVVGRRCDGYHLLDSIFLPIDLYDDIAVTITNVGQGSATSVRLHCSTPGIPLDDGNLVVRAAKAVLAERGLGAHIDVTLVKRIPAGAGLGGGSGNAATMLAGLDALLALEIAPMRLREIALGLGADVPFFLLGGPARVRGIGEDLEAIHGWPDLILVVAVPPVHVSTAWAFRALGGHALRGGDEPARLAAGAFPAGALLVNDLEEVVVRSHPEVGLLKDALANAGAAGAVMSGSGSAVLGVARSAAEAAQMAASVSAAHPEATVHVAHGLSANPGAGPAFPLSGRRPEGPPLG